jgi:hypothetical protein
MARRTSSGETLPTTTISARSAAIEGHPHFSMPRVDRGDGRLGAGSGSHMDGRRTSRREGCIGRSVDGVRQARCRDPGAFSRASPSWGKVGLSIIGRYAQRRLGNRPIVVKVKPKPSSCVVTAAACRDSISRSSTSPPRTQCAAHGRLHEARDSAVAGVSCVRPRK